MVGRQVGNENLVFYRFKLPPRYEENKWRVEAG